MDGTVNEQLRRLPKIDTLLAHATCKRLIDEHGRARVVAAARNAVDVARRELRAGRLEVAGAESHALTRIDRTLLAETARSLKNVVNATGIVLHTNLGRAPLSEDALAAIAEVARGYSNLEYDLAAGQRGSRQVHVDSRIARIAGAEAALVVNNNAAAVMLAVNTLARDAEVVTSRGELIEIGGSFRIPDVIETSEADLVETGTTNRTRVSDFARAVTPNTRVLLKVHPSNYRVVGFTEAPSREELVLLARDRGLVALEDLGSGTLVDLTTFGLPAEPTVQDAIRAGMDLVTFSGDKLLGGPQAGIVVGRADLIAGMKRNPLYRALRVDKLTLAALETTLRAYERGLSRDGIPVLQMLSVDANNLRKRAKSLARRLAKLPGLSVEVVETKSYSGGGSLPEEALPDWAVAVRREGQSADGLHHALRTGKPAVVARIADGAVLLHMRALLPDDARRIEAALSRISTA